MMYGVSSLLAIIAVGTMYTSELKLYNSIAAQVQRMDNLGTTAEKQIGAEQPGFKAILESINPSQNTN